MSEGIVCCPLYGGDDGPSASCSEVRKARKQHECCECHEAIKAGDRYEHASGIWDGEPSSFKTCLSCVEIRTHFTCESGWTYEFLWEQLEENFYEDMKAGGPCMEGLSPAAKARLFERRMAWYEKRGRRR